MAREGFNRKEMIRRSADDVTLLSNMWWNVVGMNEMRVSKQRGGLKDVMSFFSIEA